MSSLKVKLPPKSLVLLMVFGNLAVIAFLCVVWRITSQLMEAYSALPVRSRPSISVAIIFFEVFMFIVFGIGVLAIVFAFIPSLRCFQLRLLAVQVLCAGVLFIVAFTSYFLPLFKLSPSQ